MKLGVMASEEARPQGLKPRFGWRAHVAPEGATPRKAEAGRGRIGLGAISGESWQRPGRRLFPGFHW